MVGVAWPGRHRSHGRTLRRPPRGLGPIEVARHRALDAAWPAPRMAGRRGQSHDLLVGVRIGWTPQQAGARTFGRRLQLTGPSRPRLPVACDRKSHPRPASPEFPDNAVERCGFVRWLPAGWPGAYWAYAA